MTQKIHWRKTAKVCPNCNKLRSKGSWVEGFEFCAICEMDKLLQTNYKHCQICKNWFKKTEKSIDCWCDVCNIKKKEEWKKFGRSKIKKSDTFKCNICNEIKNYQSFNRNSYETCKKCKFWQARWKEGKRRCSSCMSWFPQEQFTIKKYCERCRKKENEFCRLRNKRDRNNPNHKDRFKEYCRRYYYNTFKPIYNKVLALQWTHNLIKPRRQNRNGFWYVLNHSLFQDVKRNFRGWLNETNKVIERLRTGKGRIVGNKVYFDTPSKEFKEYIDSDEAMTAAKKPTWEPQVMSLDEYFKENKH
jgi:hypothetical protein